MRVDQIITLVWVGNVALLGGTGWIGWKFWEQKQAQAQKRTDEIVWPEESGTDSVPVRWPGPVTNFRHVWETPLNGLVPPPPPPPDKPKTEQVDLAEAFRRRVSLVAVLEASNPFHTAIQVNDAQGGAKNLGVGQKIDEWQLKSAREDRPGKVYRAVFSNPAYPKGDVEITAAIPNVDMPPGQGPFVPSYDGIARPGPVPKDRVETQAFRDPSGEWQVPPEECDWWEFWGEAEVVAKTKFVERPQGLEIASQPPRGPLDNTRGLNQGDVIVSVNGTPVKSVAELLAYLRGPGRDLSRFEVVLERDGARRTQVYHLHRRRGTRP